MTETISLKISNGHQIWIRKGLPRDVGEPESKWLFPFPMNGYKYFGIYVKKVKRGKI